MSWIKSAYASSMITLQEILAIMSQDFGSYLTDGTHFLALGKYLLSPRFRAVWHSRQKIRFKSTSNLSPSVSSVKTLEEAKVARGCLYIQMPVHEYGTMQFGKFEEINNKGYHAALDILAKWDAKGLLPSAVVDGKGSIGRRKGRSARRNSI